MAAIGHHFDTEGRSAFRVFAPEKSRVKLVLVDSDESLDLVRDALGYWSASMARLPHGTRYLLEVDGARFPDPASRCQPAGVHGPSMVTAVERAHSPGWAGVKMGDAIIYELHLGTFTAQGNFVAAQERLSALAELGITVIELLPLAAFPGERNWGYDGTYLFALHQAYGSYADLKTFIEAAHGWGIAVVLDVVYNHFGPEGNYSGAFAPYTKRAPTPWGEAVNFDGEFSYGVREYFLENTRYWLQDIGFDGFRMDAVSLIFDNSPVHIVREITDLARSIARAENREILMLAEHLRNNRYVTSEQGFNFHAQWNDDLNHAVFAHLTGETVRHYANFGSFDDVVKALQQGFVLDGSRFDQVHRVLLGTDGRLTHPEQHVVHIQNHDQVGNRAQGDRMMTTYGEPRALLCITAVMASPFVPMLFMGEEYGETAPFLFFEDFSDPALVAAVQAGRNADFSFAGASPHAPHDRATWEACKLQWALRDSPQGQRVLAYYQQLIALKRSGALGPHSFSAMEVRADASRKVVWIETRQTLTVLNFSNLSQLAIVPASWRLTLASVNGDAGIDSAHLPPYGAWIFRST